MAELLSTNPTIADWSKMMDPKGNVARIVRMLSERNQILDDCVMVEGNLPTGTQVTIETGLPDVYYRMLNQGVPTSKGTSSQVTEACAIMEARSHVDVKLAKLQNNLADFRLEQARGFMNAMNRRQATTMFYGNPKTNPQEFTGLATRFSSLSDVNSQNILDAGGTTNLTSMWLVVWGEDTAFCHFPKGSEIGLTRKDLGEITIVDPTDATKYMQVYAEIFGWDHGLVVKDWRFVVRIANIDTVALMAGTGTQATTAATNIIKLLARALDKPEDLNAGRAALYCNRTVHSGLKLAAMDRQQNVLTIEQGLRSKELQFLGVPIRRCDRILNTESQVA